MNAKLSFIFSLNHPPGTRVGMHQHSCHEVVYYMYGEGSTRIGDNTYFFKPRTLCLIPPQVKHDETHHAAAKVLCVGLLPGSRQQLLSVFNHQDDESRIIHVMHRMHEESKLKKMYYEEQLDLLAGELWIELLRLSPDNRSDSKAPLSEKLKYVRKFMDENYQQKISVDDLSRFAGYSYDRFRHLFKEATGVSPQQYLLHKRMEHACNLLTLSELSIFSVAIESGFSTDAQFCSLFKRETGQTPRQFRLQSLS